MVSLERQFGTIIVGGGPAGLAVLLAAHKAGKLSDLLHQGVLIVERGRHIGAGKIGTYAINSDSTGSAFVDPLRAGREPSLHRILDTPTGQRIASAGLGAVALPDVGELLHLIGQAMHDIIERYPKSAVLTECTAQSARRQPDGTWQLALSGVAETAVACRRLILATGATQPRARLLAERVAGEPVTRWSDRLMQSGDLLTIGGYAQALKRLQGIADPRIAVLGGSTSAMATCHALLHRIPELTFADGGVTLFHRNPLHVCYTSPAEALADGYTEFGPGDICPLTNRVFRLSGLRLDSRELLMQVRGIGGRRPEPRMKLHPLKDQDPEAVRLIDAAHLVVAAFGYRPNALPLVDETGASIPLLAHAGPQLPLVDDRCRILDGDARPIPNLFGIGLAAGFLPRGKLGGEPNFNGQANGLWLWQNDVGSIIVDAVLDPSPPARRPCAAVSASSHRGFDTPHLQRDAVPAETGA